MICDIHRRRFASNKPKGRGNDLLQKIYDVPSGERFHYSDMEWVVLGREQGGTLCAATEPLFTCQFSEGIDNNWANSSLRRKLCDALTKKIDDRVVQPFLVDLTSSCGDRVYSSVVDNVGILSLSLYMKYKGILPQYSQRIWTCTPWACFSPFNQSAMVILSPGLIEQQHQSHEAGVVPICVFRDPAVAKRAEIQESLDGEVSFTIKKEMDGQYSLYGRRSCLHGQSLEAVVSCIAKQSHKHPVTMTFAACE